MANFYTSKRHQIDKSSRYRYMVISHSQSEINDGVCGICHEIAVIPVQVINNFCKIQLFCMECVEQWKKVFNTYPVYSGLSGIIPVFVSPVLPYQVKQFVFQCEFTYHGCKKRLISSEFETHVNSCPFKPCNVCRKIFTPGADHSKCEARLALMNGTSKLHSDYIELQNNLKIITEQQIALEEENAVIKKDIQTLRQKKCGNVAHSEVNTGLKLNKKLKTVAEKEIFEYCRVPTKMRTTNDPPKDWPLAQILNIRESPNEETLYYIHYIDYNKRLDEWVTKDRFDLSRLTFPEKRQNKCEVGSKSEDSIKLYEQNKALVEENKCLSQQIIALKKDNEFLRMEDKSKDVSYSELCKKFEELFILVDGIRSDLSNRD